ncbi:RagB/SusD family nutrient uptake outer membrane protein [Maribellus maritimus]|uniref:RagB/SusD family nutrient uptake outer membrane protein n=1 Tax=Maribellus maritimus TaxID=2870838 RepID=UPI001EEB5117|nr:RagB/SusD family nutrient uptake outer membrane protein [Maribellus maritimus]MCG6191073.1 RagB/SusD family nutrient uptake outer membrane protein [Maribellus maritimus]
MFKNIFKSKIVWITALALSLFSCSDFLEEEVYTQYDPNTFLQTEEGINSVLVAAYDNLQYTGSSLRERMFTFGEFPGDIMWEWGGGFEAIATVYMTYNWDSQTSQFEGRWNNLYTSIRNANSLLDNIDNVTSLSETKVKQLKAEATFIRAADYYYLWEMFGPVPLTTTTEELNFEPAKASNEEFNSFIETELTAAAADLPLEQDLWGKATKGAALSFLSRFYLNTHQWQKAADVSKQVVNLQQYELFDGDLTNMFAVENEENDEVIFTSPASTTFNGNSIMPHVFPPNYQIQSNWINWGAQFVVYSDFVNSYHADDKRLGWMLFEYTDVNGVYHDCLAPNDVSRGVRCFKYVPDPNAISQNHGNDIPMMRYAEILLNAAEAINELDGPNQESIDFINEVRERAGVPLYNVSDFSSKDELRDAILDERGWEFVSEGLRRMDLIRQGKLISRAKARGASNAQDYMTLFPIPQSELNSNPNLEQNPGYN